VWTLNKALCQAQKVEPANGKGYDAAQRLWEKSIAKSMDLSDALNVCRECHDLAPFTFNNGNTFAAIGRTLVEEFLKQMPPVEAQIIRNTIGHYIVGLIGRKELQQVMKHFEPLLARLPSAPKAPASSAAPVLQPETQRA
jgi:hypothetical protein